MRHHGVRCEDGCRACDGGVGCAGDLTRAPFSWILGPRSKQAVTTDRFRMVITDAVVGAISGGRTVFTVSSYTVGRVPASGSRRSGLTALSDDVGRILVVS